METEKNQILTLDSRSRLKVTLAENVESFSDGEIVLKTGLGVLTVRGKDLRIEDFSSENGNAAVCGRIDKMDFSEIKEKRSFIGGLFK